MDPEARRLSFALSIVVVIALSIVQPLSLAQPQRERRVAATEPTPTPTSAPTASPASSRPISAAAC